MTDSEQVLDALLIKAQTNLDERSTQNEEALSLAEEIARCTANRAPVRLLMSCLLAKLSSPHIDVRKPYTEIGGNDSFSGRTFDERHIGPFVLANDLPCNSTTAFLTPALRNMDRPLTPDIEIVGRPRSIYKKTIELLDLVFQGKVDPNALFTDVIRFLLAIRNENKNRIRTLLAGLHPDREDSSLSSEGIVKVIQLHLACKNSSRLPVLVFAAAYETVGERIGEKIAKLQSHNAADEQTGALGDIEVTLINDDQIVTCYEMKNKVVMKSDIDRAVQKFVNCPSLNNYLFITTEPIDDVVKTYADQIYRESGIEVAILDCLGFLRHFLHFFYRSRTAFLDCYQKLILTEPDSAVNQSLKEAFLSLRRAALEGN